MGNIRQRRYTIDSNGQKRELCPGVLIKSARVIPTNPERINKINRELAEKCRKQRENDAEALAWAKTHAYIC